MPDSLFQYAKDLDIIVSFCEMPKHVLGYYSRTFLPPVILLSNRLKTNRRLLRVILAEEIGHHVTGACISHPANSEIPPMLQIKNKHDHIAIWWATQHLIPISSLIKAIESGLFFTHELAEYFDVTERFMGTSLKLYFEKGGNKLLKKVSDCQDG